MCWHSHTSLHVWDICSKKYTKIEHFYDCIPMVHVRATSSNYMIKLSLERARPWQAMTAQGQQKPSWSRSAAVIILQTSPNDIAVRVACCSCPLGKNKQNRSVGRRCQSEMKILKQCEAEKSLPQLSDFFCWILLLSEAWHVGPGLSDKVWLEKLWGPTLIISTLNQRNHLMACHGVSNCKTSHSTANWWETPANQKETHLFWI